MECAIVGAGIAGLSCAQTLRLAGARVTVFEATDRPGGRCATWSGSHGAFDHGAQYFTVKDARFAEIVRLWVSSGAVAPWNARIVKLDSGRPTSVRGTTKRFVGVPGMEQLGRLLAGNLPIGYGLSVLGAERSGREWVLRTSEIEVFGPFQHLVLALPAPQIGGLLSGIPQVQSVTEAAPMRACLAVMLRFESPLDLPYDGAFVDSGPLSWIAANESKPGRGPESWWVLHSSAEFADHHDDADRRAVISTLEAAFREATGVSAEPIRREFHRWRHAIPVGEPGATKTVHFSELGLTLCGDWCAGGRIEGAWVSGREAARRCLGGDADLARS